MAVDLRGHGSAPGDLAATSMRDYADDVAAALRGAGERPVVVGWSMGGLAAMMAAADGHASACVCLAPSMPARVREMGPSVPLRRGVFGPEEYGITSLEPADQPEMPDLDRPEREVALASVGRESRYARDERKRGTVIESLPCPLLIVTGKADHQWPRKRYDGLWLKADYAAVNGASHWGLVLSRRALAAIVPDVLGWLEEAT